MTTIVMNTLTGAVSEHTLPFESVCGEYAGSHAGLFLLGGDTDAGAPVAAEITTGKVLWGDAHRKSSSSIYFMMDGEGEGDAVVAGKNAAWTYRFPVRPNGGSRAVPGRGIRENYLSFSFKNVDGADFRLDMIEVLTELSNTRRL